MTRYLVDNSVWQRLSNNPQIAARLKGMLASGDSIMTCPPQVLEYCHSARTPVEYDQLRNEMLAFDRAQDSPDDSLVLRIQRALWHGGLVRAVGAFDILIAGYAIRNSAAVLHYDSDFEHVKSVYPKFRHEWVAPRGSIS